MPIFNPFGADLRGSTTGISISGSNITFLFNVIANNLTGSTTAQSFVPYQGALSSVDLGAFSLTATSISAIDSMSASTYYGDGSNLVNVGGASGFVPYIGSVSSLDMGGFNLTATEIAVDIFLALLGDSAITTAPDAVGVSNAGWKLGMFTNDYAIGIATWTLAILSNSWVSTFDPGAGYPANDATALIPDSNAQVSFGGGDGSVSARGSVCANKVFSSGLTASVNTGNEALIQKGVGSVPGMGPNVALVVQNNNETNKNCEVEILAGSAGSSSLLFGDEDGFSPGSMKYNHGSNTLAFVSTNNMTLLAAAGNINFTTPGGNSIFSSHVEAVSISGTSISSGAFFIGATNINIGTTLSNVAYLDQANVFTNNIQQITGVNEKVRWSLFNETDGRGFNMLYDGVVDDVFYISASADGISQSAMSIDFVTRKITMGFDTGNDALSVIGDASVRGGEFNVTANTAVFRFRNDGLSSVQSISASKLFSSGITAEGNLTVKSTESTENLNAIDLRPDSNNNTQGGLGVDSGGRIGLNANNRITLNIGTVERTRINNNGLTSNGLGLFKASAGTIPTLDSGENWIFQNNANTTDRCRVNILAGNAAFSILNFGDAQNNNQGSLQYDHTSDELKIIVSNNAEMTVDSNGVDIVNTLSAGSSISSDLDIAASHMIFANGNDTTSASPSAAAQNTGWKIGLWGNAYAIGVSPFTLSLLTSHWVSLFDTENALPAEDGSATKPDSNAQVSFGGSNGSITANGTISGNQLYAKSSATADGNFVNKDVVFPLLSTGGTQDSRTITINVRKLGNASSSRQYFMGHYWFTSASGGAMVTMAGSQTVTIPTGQALDTPANDATVHKLYTNSSGNVVVEVNNNHDGSSINYFLNVEIQGIVYMQQFSLFTTTA